MRSDSVFSVEPEKIKQGNYQPYVPGALKRNGDKLGGTNRSNSNLHNIPSGGSREKYDEHGVLRVVPNNAGGLPPSNNDILNPTLSNSFNNLHNQLTDTSNRSSRNQIDKKGGYKNEGIFRPEATREQYMQDGRSRSRLGGDRRNLGNGQSNQPRSWRNRNGRKYLPENEIEVFGIGEDHVSAGINFDSYENIPVEVTGLEVGKDITLMIDFDSLTTSVNEILNTNIKKLNYSKPTPIQKYSIPIIMDGQDIMACAQTGSGKTAAFLIPFINHMLTDGPPAREHDNYWPCKPVMLIISPTRELSVQIHQESKKFQYNTGIRTVPIYGGADAGLQIREMRKGCDIMVGTPGRLLDFINRGNVDFKLIKYMVLDEADRMLDMGFTPQIREICENKQKSIYFESNSIQTVMFSATFPAMVRKIAQEFLRDYIYIVVGRVGSTNDFIQQNLVYADEMNKLRELVVLLKNFDLNRTIIFVETKKRADQLNQFLCQESYPCTNIHGDKAQNEREYALKLFKSGECPILVATDVAARGLDIPNVTHVINYDLPSSIDDYVHRIGRTGRAGNKGNATSFVSSDNKSIVKDLYTLLKDSKQPVPKWFESMVRNNTGYGSHSFMNNKLGSSHGFGGGSMQNGAKKDNYKNKNSFCTNSNAVPIGSMKTQNAQPTKPSNTGFSNRSQVTPGFQDSW